MTGQEWRAFVSEGTRSDMGAGPAREYGRRDAVEGELLVRVTPTKVVARSGVAEPAGA